MRRRMVAGAAVIGGTAYHAKRRAQAGRGTQAPQVPDDAPAAEPAQDSVEQIRELAELREQGILTEEEFAAEKKRLLGL